MLLPLLFTTALSLLSPGSDSTYLLVGPMDYNDSVACADTVRAIREIPIDTFAPHSFSGSNGIDIRYRLLSPEQVAPDSLYPLVVVFHGAGEMGTGHQVPLRLLAGEECAQWLFAHHGARQTKHNIR